MEDITAASTMKKGLTRLFMLAFLWGQFRQFAETPIDSHFVHGTEGSYQGLINRCCGQILFLRSSRLKWRQLLRVDSVSTTIVYFEFGLILDRQQSWPVRISWCLDSHTHDWNRRRDHERAQISTTSNWPCLLVWAIFWLQLKWTNAAMPYDLVEALFI